MNDTLWIALLVALTLFAGRLAKLYPGIPKGLMPAFALLLGAVMYVGKVTLLDEVPIVDALTRWTALLAGAGAIVGHDLIKPVLVRWLGPDWAVIIMGRLEARKAPTAKKPPGVAIGGLVLVLALSGCAAFSQLAKSVAGSNWLGAVLDVAEAGAETYFARHPSQREAEIVAAGLDVARANAAYAEALAHGRDGVAEKAAALEAYRRYFALLTESRVLSGLPPGGGAEGDSSIEVGPVDMPAPAVVAGAL